MAKRSSSSTEVLLGLLTIEPMSGYDLGQTIRASVGHFWNESYGQIYPNLKKLAAGGFVSSKTERRKGKPDRQVYSITAKGRQRMANWLAVDPQPEIPRNELLLKLFFGAQASSTVLARYVESMADRERAVLGMLDHAQAQIDAQKQYPGSPFWKMVTRFGQLELEAHLQWAEETIVHLDQLNKRTATAGKRKIHAGN